MYETFHVQHGDMTLEVSVRTTDVKTHAKFSEKPHWWTFIKSAINDAVERCVVEK